MISAGHVAHLNITDDLLAYKDVIAKVIYDVSTVLCPSLSYFLSNLMFNFFFNLFTSYILWLCDSYKTHICILHKKWPQMRFITKLASSVDCIVQI